VNRRSFFGLAATASIWPLFPGDCGGAAAMAHYFTKTVEPTPHVYLAYSRLLDDGLWYETWRHSGNPWERSMVVGAEMDYREKYHFMNELYMNELYLWERPRSLKRETP